MKQARAKPPVPQSWRALGAWLLPTVAAGVAACMGSISDPGGNDGPGANEDPVAHGDPLTRVAASGLRRLTIREYNDTVRDLLGDTSEPARQWLPEDQLTPFDNDYTSQLPSSVLIEGAETVAAEIAARFIDKVALRDEVIGCTPKQPDDAECFRHFIESFGRRAFRRPLEKEEVEGFMPLLSFATTNTTAVQATFYTAIETALHAFLQHPNFLYRVEIGTQVEGYEGLYALSGWEKATRLSYLLWGSTPSDELLAKAEAGELATPAQVRTVASAMLTDPRALERIDRFHALWFGYDTLPLEANLTSAMRQETQALLQRVVFEEKQPWSQLFLSNETYVDAMLAEHYGLESAPPGGGWVSYGSSRRQGLLSHGSYLAANVLGADTSPTMRGKLIRTRLLCQDIPPPPENVNADDLPESDSPCKKDVRAVYMTGACRGCHVQMDPIGYGLEAYDRQGRFRTHEPGHPQCTIDGEGAIEGVGKFNGPAGLSNLVAGSDELRMCLTTQLFRFATGRYELDATDAKFIQMLMESTDSIDSMRFDELLLAFVGSEEFGYRRDEPTTE